MVHRQKLTPIFFWDACDPRAVNKVPSLRKPVPIKSQFLGSAQPLGWRYLLWAWLVQVTFKNFKCTLGGALSLPGLLLFFGRERGAGCNSFCGHSKLIGMRKCVNRKRQMMWWWARWLRARWGKKKKRGGWASLNKDLRTAHRTETREVLNILQPDMLSTTMKRRLQLHRLFDCLQLELSLLPPIPNAKVNIRKKYSVPLSHIRHTFPYPIQTPIATLCGARIDAL